jgi:hypothetical protein
MIKFQCPSGHTISAPENLAGKPGRCPKCNASFVVPEPVEIGLEELEPFDDPLPPITPEMGSGKGNVTAGEVFVFLCPNGHKLHGPPSLKGKAGQCPHCNARFRIPTDEDLEPPDEELSLGDDHVPAEYSGGAAAHAGDAHAGNAEHVLDYPPPGPRGLGYIVGRLWDWRTQDTELEIFLAEGEIVVPDYYSEFLSTSDFGVFGMQESDGSYAISVIPWSTVRRVAMRRLSDLSGDVFQ